MVVVASAVVTVVIVVGAVALVLVVFLAFGPLSRGESLRDDVQAEMGPLGTTPGLSEETREELAGDRGFDEERLDQRNE